MSNIQLKPKATSGIFQPISGGNGVVIFTRTGIVKAYKLSSKRKPKKKPK